MTLTIKRKVGNKFEVIPMPPEEEVTVKHNLLQFTGQDVIAEHDNGIRKIYGLGHEGLRGKWSEDKIIMDWKEFCLYWQYTLLNYGLDTFARIEKREERIAIMEAENVPRVEIKRVLEQYPLLYGTDV